MNKILDKCKCNKNNTVKQASTEGTIREYNKYFDCMLGRLLFVNSQ